MGANKHTPGPWTDYAHTEVRAPNKFTVAIITKPGLRNDVTDANARLIAAAPELLDMLKKARECIAYCRRAHKDAQSGDGVPIEVFIDDVIARAEGRTTCMRPLPVNGIADADAVVE